MRAGKLPVAPCDYLTRGIAVGAVMGLNLMSEDLLREIIELVTIWKNNNEQRKSYQQVKP